MNRSRRTDDELNLSTNWENELYIQSHAGRLQLPMTSCSCQSGELQLPY